jgi:hypothetical protein
METCYKYICYTKATERSPMDHEIDSVWGVPLSACCFIPFQPLLAQPAQSTSLHTYVRVNVSVS